MKMRLLLLSILLISSPHLAAGMFDQLIQEGVNAVGKGIKKASGGKAVGNQVDDKSASTETSPADGGAVNMASPTEQCNASYEELGPRMYGTFHGGDNLQDVLCKLKEMQKSSKFEIEVGRYVEVSLDKPCPTAAATTESDRLKLDKYGTPITNKKEPCIVKIGMLGDFGEKINNQYINLVTRPDWVRAAPIVIGGINFEMMLTFSKVESGRPFYGFPIYRLKNGQRNTFSRTINSYGKDHPSLGGITVENLQNISLNSIERDKTVVASNKKGLIDSFDNAYKSKNGYTKELIYEVRPTRKELEYQTLVHAYWGDGPAIQVTDSKNGEIYIIYEVEMSKTSQARKIFNFFESAEKLRLDKIPKKKDTGKI
jgi:hypothetical protein